MEHLEGRDASTEFAPDGSLVRLLLSINNLTTAQFEFPARSVSVAVQHRTVSEVWHVIAGSGDVWSSDGPSTTVSVAAGHHLSIKAGEKFQVRVTSDDALIVLGVTTPPWPGEGEAEIVDGPWEPTLAPGEV